MIIAAVSDLIFRTSITKTAQASSAPLTVVRTAAEFIRAAAEHAPRLVIVDLNLTGADPLELIHSAVGLAPRPRIVAYVSHVQVALAQAAESAGADQVLPRSAFVKLLPTLFSPDAP